MTMISRTSSQVVALAVLMTLASCGGSKGGSTSTTKNPTTTPPQKPQEERQMDEGIYRAVIKPLNASVASNATSGNFIIKISGDDVVVKGRITGAPAGVMHRQQVRVLGSCPDASADKNADGIIDARELKASSGAILIPLDRDLSEQVSGISFGPIANANGAYVYKSSTTLTRLLADLRDLDPDKQDDLVKLNPEHNLNLADKQIVILGVGSETELPATVAGSEELSAAQALPIGCGELVRISREEEATVPVETPTVETL